MSRYSNQWLGNTSIAIPISFRWYSTMACGLTALIVLFVTCFSYTDTETTDAVISSASGINRVLAPFQGTVTVKYAEEGQIVKKGEPLYEVRRFVKAGDDNQDVLLKRRALSLESERARLATSASGSNPRRNTPERAERALLPRMQPMDSNIGAVTIRAAEAGLVYEMASGVGDFIYDLQPIATIVPERGDLIVVAEVTATAQARIKKGDALRVQLSAYKNRLNGKLSGRVTEIGMNPTDNRNQRPDLPPLTYKITMRIDQRTAEHLREDLLGKSVEIKIPLEKRKLYEWLIDPMRVLFGSA